MEIKRAFEGLMKFEYTETLILTIFYTDNLIGIVCNMNSCLFTTMSLFRKLRTLFDLFLSSLKIKFA